MSKNVSSFARIDINFYTKGKKYKKSENLMKKIARALLMGLSLPSISKSDEIVTIFAHGLGGDKTQGHYYHINSRQNGFIEGNLETFNFKDYLNPRSSCLGQTADIAILQETSVKFKKVILVGVSRGAATIANYAGTEQPNNVMALILESPFDTIESIVKHLEATASSIVFKPSMYPNYDRNGIHPIDSMHKTSVHIPILLICSKKDVLIPASSTTLLYKKLLLAGHTKIHILVLDQGKHANILWGDQGYIYKNVVHAFYKEYGLPYNQMFAQSGLKHFAFSQPSLEELDKMLVLPSRFTILNPLSQQPQ